MEDSLKEAVLRELDYIAECAPHKKGTVLGNRFDRVRDYITNHPSQKPTGDRMAALKTTSWKETFDRFVVNGNKSSYDGNPFLVTISDADHIVIRKALLECDYNERTTYNHQTEK